MLSKTGRFQRADRILCSRDFRRVVKVGKRKTSRSFVVVVATRGEFADGDRRRLGVTVNKRVGNAVARNRLKRSIREWFRHAREVLPKGSDTVVIARRTACDLPGSEVSMILDRMVRDVKDRADTRTAAEFR